MTSNCWFNVDPPPHNYQYIYTNSMHQVNMFCCCQSCFFSITSELRDSNRKEWVAALKPTLKYLSNTSVLQSPLPNWFGSFFQSYQEEGMLRMDRVRGNKSIIKQTLKDYTSFLGKKTLPWQRKLQKWHLGPVFSSILTLCIPDGRPMSVGG